MTFAIGEPKRQIRAPDYMEPMLSEHGVIPNIDALSQQVDLILQAREDHADPRLLNDTNLTATAIDPVYSIDSTVVSSEGSQPVESEGSEIRFFLHISESSRFILVDIESINVVDVEYEHVKMAADLRESGRELLASEVAEMLQNAKDDPNEVEIELFSLQEMAEFLIKNKEFPDPIVGPNPYGIMQIEWHIKGDGLLVMVFWGNGQVHCVARADATSDREEIRESVRLSIDDAVEKFGELVPAM